MEFLHGSPSLVPTDPQSPMKGFPHPLINSPSQQSDESLPSFNLEGNGDSTPERALSPSDPISTFLRSSPQRDPCANGHLFGDDNASSRKRTFLSFLNGDQDSNPKSFDASAEALVNSEAPHHLERAGSPEPESFFGLERSFCQTRRRQDADTWQPPAVDIPATRDPEAAQASPAEELTAADFLDFFKSSGNSNAEKRLLSNLMSGEAGPFHAEQPRGSQQAASQEASPALAISLLSSAALELGLAGGSSLDLSPGTLEKVVPTQQGERAMSEHALRCTGQQSSSILNTSSAPSSEMRPKKKPKIQDLVLFWLKGQKFFSQAHKSAKSASAGQGSGESVGSQSKGSNSPPSPSSPATRAVDPQEQCGESAGTCDTPRPVDQLLNRVKQGEGLHRESSRVGPIDLRAIEAWAKAREAKAADADDSAPLALPHRLESGLRSQGSVPVSSGSFGTCATRPNMESLEGQREKEREEESLVGKGVPARGVVKRSPLSVMQRADSIRSEHTVDPMTASQVSLEPSQMSLDKTTSLGRGMSGDGSKITPRSMVEKRRRERISVAFSGLKDVVNVQGDMAHVLHEAAKIIKEQQKRLQDFQERELIQKLRDEVYNDRMRH